MRTYRAAIVGLGNVAYLYERDPLMRSRYRFPTHLSAYRAHPRLDLVAGADPDERRRHGFCEASGVRSVYADYAEMLEVEKPDLLSVCVPPAAQYEVARAAIAAGVPAVLCEKPFTERGDLAGDLVRRARKAGTALVVNYWRRYDPSHAHARQLIASGELGEIQHVRCVYGNGLANTGSHVINLLLWFFGPVASVRALWDRRAAPSDPCVDAWLSFATGVRAVMSPCDYGFYRILEVDVLGATGRLVIANEGLDILRYRVEPNAAVSSASQLARDPDGVPSTVGEAFYRVVGHVVSMLDSPGEADASGAVETHLVLEAMRESAAHDGCAVVATEGVGRGSGP